ncbi:ATP-grasp domain-containing protein [Rhizobium sp. MHM7A]|uniref:ATP-grasp domain-containing protein n=1 Tax=Rhizobium sp. MHM7A TaxID=2583233 RepID=UPI001105DB68|nr:ATP-grasp domain-containing protein [Rhizobium sp. MHM7A]TLX15962.1 ATP-grasp domain-containing protein [Rhizobium sp. MHM7A]
MKTVLVTGARSPAALEICRGLQASGSRVVAADSMRFPICRFSNSVDRSVRIAPPRQQPKAFVRDLNRIIADEKVDIIIPTCEELFHLALYQQEINCQIFTGDIAQLSSFHDKYRFLQCAEPYGISIPKTAILNTREAMLEIANTSAIEGDKVNGLVFKRVFSRFAEGTFVKPTAAQLDAIHPTAQNRYIAQEFIPGEEFCCYAIAAKGKLKAISIYKPSYRAGRGAGIFFEPLDQPEIKQFVRAFVDGHSFTGQVSFDFIAAPEGRTYVIECNPRATSGVHLLDKDTDWNRMFSIGPEDEDHCHTPRMESKMVALAMLTYGLKNARPRAFLTDWKRAKDVTYRRNDVLPAVGQLATMTEFLLRSARKSISPLAATTHDIEWNGND